MKYLITIADIDNWGACCRRDGERYSDENLAFLLGGRSGLAPVEILRDKRIRAADRLWAVLRPEVIGEEMYMRFGHARADHGVENHCLYCGVAAAETWAQRWLDGTDRSREGAARAARAAGAAARADAWAAARAAEAWVAGEARAALDSERQWQCEKLAKMIGEETT